MAADETMRVRIAWGGGGQQLWEGNVALSNEGSLAEPRPLGIGADEPGSMWLEAGQLVIRQRSARTYDGVDLLVNAPLESKLLIRLRAADGYDEPDPVEIPLSQLATEYYHAALDERGNRLLVRRSPGDVLRIRLERDSLSDSLVFSSQDEVFRCILEPHLLPVPPGTKIRLDARLVAAGSDDEWWSEQSTVWSGQPVDIPLNVPVPGQEGVYELIITAKQQPKPLQPFDWNRTVAQRKVQFLVLRPDRGASPETQGPLKTVVEIDPAKPGWRERLAKIPHLPKIPRLWNGPLSSGHITIRRHPLGDVVQLSPSAEAADVSWEAYTLPINQAGQPHVLEVEYPSDVAQTMGISILEPNAAGALLPIGLDSGVDCPEAIAGKQGGPRWVAHRLIFWPRTTTPMVLITNRRDHDPAVFGKIRVLAGWRELPRAFADRAEQPRRLLAAYFDRPLFPESFSATEALDPEIGRGMDDWRTFYEGGTRLVEYLEHVGYNALVIMVLADGSTIYPSTILEPTPRYDTGLFFASAQDPVRKDVLEMLFRLFDRQRLQLIPALEYAAPLPALEAIRRQGGPQAEAVEWIGADGNPRFSGHAPQTGLGPYYNTLHPRVQEEMLRVVREVVDRYAHHSSFGGLAIRLSAEGYAQLPGPEWGLDDLTIARFQEDSKCHVPGNGPQRFAQRAAFLAGEGHGRWLDWRAGQLSRFYHRVHAELTGARPGARLFLTPAESLAGGVAEGPLRPALPQTVSMEGALLRVGIDAQRYQDARGPVLLRPQPIVPGARLAAQAVSLTIEQMPDADDYFRGLPTPGSLFFHPPQEVRVASFDEKSYFQPSYTQLVAQLTPSDYHNRRRFAGSLAALDAQVVFDGGWMLPMGQEASIRELVGVYRRLPAVRFHRLGEARGPTAAQPVTFRYASDGQHTYLYAVNNAPFATTARVGVQGAEGSRMEELSGLRRVAGLKRDTSGTYWMVQLRPYDVVAVRFSKPGVSFYQPQISLPGSVETALKQRIHEMAARVASLRSPPPPMKVLVNPGFERPPAEGNSLPGWATTRRPGVTIAPDKSQRRGGKQSARLASTGPVACLVSQPFRPPATGRLSMRVWLRVADSAAQPPLRLAVEGKLRGHPYYRFAPVGLKPQNAAEAPPIGTDWSQPPFVFRVDDLPLQGLTELRVRFDLMGPGEVWIDDVQLFDLDFSEVDGHKNELTELYKLITLANVTLEDGEVGDCLRLLEGYWPRFLQQHVPLAFSPPPVARKPDQPAPGPARQPPPRTGLMDRLKGMLPKSLWF